MTDWYVIEGINPVPWTAASFGSGRAYKSGLLTAYQSALAEEMRYRYPDAPCEPGIIELRFMFWRRLEKTYKGHNQVADATNLQKSAEDALQGVLYDNDQKVIHVSSWVVRQDKETEPRIAVCVRRLDPSDIPALDSITTITPAEKQVSDNQHDQNPEEVF